MSLQMFMKIDGVSGDSKNFQHKGWSEFLSWNWDMTSNRTTAKESDGDQTSLNEISVIKNIGVDSADIRLLFAQGKTIPSVVLSITPVAVKRQAATKYLSMTLEQVIIKSIVTGGGVEDLPFKEHLTLLFDRIGFEYNKNVAVIATNPTAISEDYEFGWNVSSNAQWTQPSNTQ